MPYKLSKDYNLLFDKLVVGEELVGFVDYQFTSLKGKYDPSRDVCKIIRKGQFDINLGARGISYGSISELFSDTHSELELFVLECKRLNLLWIIN
jgi:hypothetical protein